MNRRPRRAITAASLVTFLAVAPSAGTNPAVNGADLLTVLAAVGMLWGAWPTLTDGRTR